MKTTKTTRGNLITALLSAMCIAQAAPAYASSTDPTLTPGHTIYKCNGEEQIADRFTSIMTIGRIFQLAFAIPGKLEPCVSVSPSNEDQEVGEPAATIGGQYFIESTIGGPEKCMYILSGQKQEWEAMIAFDRLSAEYTIQPDSSGNAVLHVPGADRAVCTQFDDPRTFRGRYPSSGQGVCVPYLEIGGPLFINPAIRALRYVFTSACPHTELRPY